MSTSSEKEDSSRNIRESWIDRLASRRGMIYLAGFSLVLLFLTGLGAWYFFQSGPWVKKTDLKITPPASLQDLATQYPELGAILQDPKLDSVYKDFLMAYQEGGAEAAYDLARKRGLVNERNELRMTLVLDTTESDAIVAELEASGIIVTAASSNLIDIIIPPGVFEAAMQSGGANEFLESLTGLEHVVRIRLPIPDIQGEELNVGDVESESLSLINAYAWHEAGFTGKGLKVAILDLGFDKYQSMLGTELPEHVIARSFVYGKEIDDTGIHHGTACAEIVHDIAPDAELVLVTSSTIAEWYQAVDWLVSEGVSIISFSAGSSVGALDGNEERARKVDEVVSGGIIWVSAAGNEADVHYRGPFTDEDGDGYHEFSLGDETLEFYSAEEEQLVLNWDAWDTGDQDFNLYLLDDNYNEIASSEYVQDGSEKDASEVLLFDLPYEGTYYASIYASRVTRPAVLDFFAVYAGEIEYPVAEHSLCVPGDARTALTVGATNWSDDSLEKYSSQGATTDGRLKPELTAPDKVSSAAYGKAFSGTSASTPHVAGAAALVRQAYPNFTAQQVVEFLESRAVDLGGGGPDNAYGYGRLWLGEPPSEVAMLPPGATQMTPTKSLEAMSTTSSSAVLTPQETATRTLQPTSTPKTRSSGSGSNLQSLAFLGCVILPGLLGFGGLCLLGGALYLRRSQLLGAASATPIAPVGFPSVTPALGESRGEQIQCSSCGCIQRSGAKYCRRCGYKLRPGAVESLTSLNCENCGQSFRSTSKFCPRCGKPRQNWGMKEKT